MLLRRMIRWSIRCPRSVRSSVLYLLGNCPSVQLLALKRCTRFFRKCTPSDDLLEDKIRFVG